MKFLVLALCVCAASAASLQTFNQYQRGYKTPVNQYATAQAVAEVVPVVPAAKTVYDYTPVTVEAAKAAVTPYVASAKAVSAKNFAYGPEQTAEVLRQSAEVYPEGHQYAYETSNGIVAESTGTLKRIGDVDAHVVQGSYKYVGPDGQTYLVTYIADENGFQPQGEHLPVGPEVPEDIARSLEYIRSHPAPVENVVVKKF